MQTQNMDQNRLQFEDQQQSSMGISMSTPSTFVPSPSRIGGDPRSCSGPTFSTYFQSSPVLLTNDVQSLSYDHPQVNAMRNDLIAALRTIQDDANRQSERRGRNEYEEFYLFIKILFRCLENHRRNSSASRKPSASSATSAGGRPDLKQLAKLIVADCTLRNRHGEADYASLTQAVERRLRPVVGERYWTMAQIHLQRVLQREVRSRATRGAATRQQQGHHPIQQQPLSSFPGPVYEV